MFSKYIFKILGLILFSIYLIYPFQCSADMIAPSLFTPLFIYPFAFAANFLINLLILVIILLIFRQISFIKTGKFIKYAFFVTLGGFFIDLIYVVPKFLLDSFIDATEFIYTESEIMDIPILGYVTTLTTLLPFFILLTLACLIVYNYWLSKKTFNFTPSKSFLLGLLIGILTCPIYSPLFVIGRYILERL